MKRWVHAVVAALIAVLIGLLVRVAFVDAQGFRMDDLQRYRQSYGIHLPDWYGDHPLLLAWTRGDGQAFVTIAQDPLARDVTLDLGAPAYRMMRVGYSLIARAAVAWQADLIPIGLFGVNLAAMGILGGIAGWKVSDWGLRAMFLPANPAVLIGISADTAEVVGVLLLTWAMMSSRRWVALISGALLGMTRPSYVTAVPAGRRGTTAALAVILVAIAIQVWLIAARGVGYGGTLGTVTLPFMGYIEAWGNIDITARLACAAVVVAGVATIMKAVRTPGSATRLALAGTGLLAVSLGPVVVSEPVNLLRAVGALPLLWIIPAATGEKDGD